MFFLSGLAVKEVFMATLKPENNGTLLTLFSAAINKENAFKSNCFSPVKKGIFWFHVFFGTRNLIGPVNVSLNSRENVSLTDWSYSAISASGQMTAIADLLFIETNDTICTALNDVSLFNKFNQLSFMGFRVDDQVLALVVALKSEIRYDNDSVTFARNHLVVNWKDTGGYGDIEVPVSGVYLIAVNAFIVGYLAPNHQSERTLNALFCKNCVEIKLENSKGSTLDVMTLESKIRVNSSETVLLNGITLHKMEAGDKLLIFLTAQKTSRLIYHILFFEPLLKMRIAWSICIHITSYYFDFIVHVDYGKVWNSEHMSIRTNISGLYYVALTVMSISLPRQPVVNVYLNNTKVVFATDTSPDTPEWYDESKTAALIHLGSEDFLLLKIYYKELYTELAYFTGFLLYPD